MTHHEEPAPPLLPKEPPEEPSLKPANLGETEDKATEEAPERYPGFDVNLIKSYPKSNRKVSIEFAPYSLLQKEDEQQQSQSLHISPHGLEFYSRKPLEEGMILKINIVLPDYWNRKQKIVEYRRVDSPETFSVLAKVIKTEEVGSRRKKRIITAQTVNMDKSDEQVLKSFLAEG